MVAGILADIYQFSEEDLRRCRAQSVINVKKANGRVSLEQRRGSSGSRTMSGRIDREKPLPEVWRGSFRQWIPPLHRDQGAGGAAPR